MQQDAWNTLYADLENDVAALVKRGVDRHDTAVFIQIDRARFAIDKGDNAAAIVIIQDLRSRLRKTADIASAVESKRGASPVPGPLPTLDRLDALEDMLHGQKRFGSARLEIVGEEEEFPTRNASRNAHVNRSIKFDDIGDELAMLFNTARIREEKRDAVRAEADRVIANRAVYEDIEGDTKVPWWFTGLIHGMECSFSLNKHLHNGDSLKARTWQVPAGHPKSGAPPFAFNDSACDALECDGFAGKTDWPLAMVLYRLERYNGFGYRKKFGTASPYLWSYTNHFTSGKYVKDGVYDPDATSKQCGAAAMLRDLIERGVVAFEAPLQTVSVTPPKPEPQQPAAITPAAPATPAAAQPAVQPPAPQPPAPPTSGSPASTVAPSTSSGSPEAAKPAAGAVASQPAASATAMAQPGIPAPPTAAPATAATPVAAPAVAAKPTTAPQPSTAGGASAAVLSALSALAAATKPATVAASGEPKTVELEKPSVGPGSPADVTRGGRK